MTKGLHEAVRAFGSVFSKAVILQIFAEPNSLFSRSSNPFVPDGVVGDPSSKGEKGHTKENGT